MRQKIDRVLDSVEEPQSRLSVARLGLVQRVRYNPSRKKLTVFISPIDAGKGCCTVASALLLSTTLERLKAGFRAEFPDLAIELL